MSVAARPLFAVRQLVRPRARRACTSRGRRRRAPAPRLLALNDGARRGARRRPDGAARPATAWRCSPATPCPTGADAGRAGLRRPPVRRLLAPARRRPRAAARRGRSTSTGGRRDLHLKGSGRTPFARGGDGKAAVGPMLREYVDRRGDARARHPDDARARRRRHRRGRRCARRCCPARCSRASPPATCASARSSTRRCTATRRCVRRLADYAIARHHPQAAEADNPYLALSRRASSTRRPRSSRSGCSSASSTA